MKVKLSEIVKFPVKYSVCCEEAIDQCDKTIEIDEEKIAKLIQVTIHGVDCTVRDYPIDKLAKAISEALPDLIKEF